MRVVTYFGLQLIIERKIIFCISFPVTQPKRTVKSQSVRASRATVQGDRSSMPKPRDQQRALPARATPVATQATPVLTRARTAGLQTAPYISVVQRFTMTALPRPAPVGRHYACTTAVLIMGTTVHAAPVCSKFSRVICLG